MICQGRHQLVGSIVAGISVLVVSCWTTIARDRTRPPLTRSPILIITTSHPRNLLFNSEIEQCAIVWAPFAVEPESDGPNLLQFQRALGADYAARIPRTPPLWPLDQILSVP
jgi:hypothetical protein